MGHTPWNKGLTKDTDPRVAKCASNLSESVKGRTPWNKGKKGCQEAWNKGLTKDTDDRIAKYAKSLEAETLSAISKRNNIAARKRFGIYKNFDMCLHHIDVTLKDRDPERYAEWRDEDLTVMTRADHKAFHNKLQFQGDNNPMSKVNRNKRLEIGGVA